MEDAANYLKFLAILYPQAQDLQDNLYRGACVVLVPASVSDRQDSQICELYRLYDL